MRNPETTWVFLLPAHKMPHHRQTRHNYSYLSPISQFKNLQGHIARGNTLGRLQSITGLELVRTGFYTLKRGISTTPGTQNSK